MALSRENDLFPITLLNAQPTQLVGHDPRNGLALQSGRVVPYRVCGRFTQRWTWAQLATLAEPFWQFPPAEEDPAPRLNIAPTQAARVIRTGGTGPELLPMRWGFPRCESGKPAGDVINARSETVTSIPMFKGAMAKRRCLVPTSGFYEWEKKPDGSKQPWYLVSGAAPLFFLAGLWQDGESGPEFAVLTYPTPAGFQPAIHHRMPGVVLPERAAEWLGTASGREALSAAAPFGDPFPVEAWPVSTRVNSPANTSPDLINPVEPDGSLF